MEFNPKVIVSVALIVMFLLYNIVNIIDYIDNRKYINSRKEISKMKSKNNPMNAVVLNGKITELTEDQVKSIIDGLGGKETKGARKLSSIKAGETFKIGKREFIVLEQSGDTTAVLSRNLIEDKIKFGDSPSFDDSCVKILLDKFAEEIQKEVGSEAVVMHKVDQTTLDGMTHYGCTKALASLMTIDHVRKYADVLDKHKANKWYWLVTPWSTPERGWKSTVCAVAPSGYVSSIISSCGLSGVRPFCILKSDIFVS